MAGYLRTRTRVVSESGGEHVIIGQEGLKVPAAEQKLTVGEVEKLTGVSATTLRHYDSIGLLTPARSGEGVSNNRKLYDADDLARLQAIMTLSGYQFALDEIREILDDDESDIYLVMQEKLVELKRQETRLRNLYLFTKFIDLTEIDLLEGLACGPSDLDQLADIARQSSRYGQTIEKLLELSDEAAEELLEKLIPIMADFLVRDETEGFAGLMRPIEAFIDWWSDSIVPLDEVGFLGFWSLFEDHSLVAERVEMLGETGDAAFLQMSLFYLLMVRIVNELGFRIAQVARLSGEDVVAALEENEQLNVVIAKELLGSELASKLTSDRQTELGAIMLSYLEGLLEDEELCRYFGSEMDASFGVEDIEAVLRLSDVMLNER